MWNLAGVQVENQKAWVTLGSKSDVKIFRVRSTKFFAVCCEAFLANCFCEIHIPVGWEVGPVERRGSKHWFPFGKYHGKCYLVVCGCVRMVFFGTHEWRLSTVLQFNGISLKKIIQAEIAAAFGTKGAFSKHGEVPSRPSSTKQCSMSTQMSLPQVQRATCGLKLQQPMVGVPVAVSTSIKAATRSVIPKMLLACRNVGRCARPVPNANLSPSGKRRAIGAFCLRTRRPRVRPTKMATTFTSVLINLMSSIRSFPRVNRNARRGLSSKCPMVKQTGAVKVMLWSAIKKMFQAWISANLAA